MEAVDPLRFILAFMFVIGLIGLSAFALKRYSRTALGKRLLNPVQGEGRLRIVELCYIDARRKLVLVRRDQAEHLLLLADGRELVVESWEAVGLDERD